VFIQVIKGKAADRAGIKRLMDRWEADLRAGAPGYLGTTAGVTDEGIAVMLARFASADDAAANAKRPEQDAWWSEMERCFDGAVSFRESDDVEVYGTGEFDRGRFVQVMEGTCHDVAAGRGFMAESSEPLDSFRPDVLGGAGIFFGDGTYTDVVYFTTEEEAREGETRAMPPEVQAAFARMQELFSVSEYLDLREPWLY
jgi:hypothetical protein